MYTFIVYQSSSPKKIFRLSCLLFPSFSFPLISFLVCLLAGYEVAHYFGPWKAAFKADLLHLITKGGLFWGPKLIRIVQRVSEPLDRGCKKRENAWFRWLTLALGAWQHFSEKIYIAYKTEQLFNRRHNFIILSMQQHQQSVCQVHWHAHHIKSPSYDLVTLSTAGGGGGAVAASEAFTGKDPSGAWQPFASEASKSQIQILTLSVELQILHWLKD